MRILVHLVYIKVIGWRSRSHGQTVTQA